MTSLAERAAQLSPQAREVLARELIRAGTVFPVDEVPEPVAVVGIGCRFPGDVVGPESFWRLLVNGEDAVGEVPANRWDADAFYDPDPAAPGRMTTKWGGFVADVAGFDADFFAISPREAAAMDPQQRMLLEVAWEALEHAGIPPDSLGGTRTGVMMGLSTWDYTIVNVEHQAEIDAYVGTGNPHSTAVGRISYLLGLGGPAVAVDTACSSSLVAVHLACQSLRLRESDLALAGGVQLSLSPFTSIALSKWSALSPRGRCSTFDAAADGFVRGEGAGVVVLKRLADALRDGDRVLAVVRGSAVNQDGRSNGLTAPNVLAQRDVITQALRVGAVAPDTVNYIEAHGTGTVLGDPIEFEALAATYGRGEVPCALGAVKTNLGHLEAAAGIAGLIKAVLVLERGQIPPNLHFTRWNPAIDAAATRLFVPTDMASWPQCPGPRRAGVSSFGISGTNAHVVLEQGPVVDPVVVGPGPVVTSLVVSGKTAERVALTAGMLAEWMDGDGADVVLADVAHTLNHHRARQVKFATVCARDRGQAVAGLRALAAGDAAPGVVGPHEGRCGPGTVFVFSGQGSQWAGMGRRLLADEPVFAAAVAELEPVFVEEVGFSLQRVLAAGEPVVGIERIQPVLVGVQLALTALWRSYGVEPDAVIGHSMGEVSAAVVAGALSPAQGLRVIARRSGLMAGLAGRGAMALLELDAAAVEGLIADYSDVTVAVYASPRQTVIAGPPEQVDAVIAAVDAQGRLARRIEVDVASHHPTVDPILAELRGGLSDLVPRPPVIPVISTTGHTGGGVMFDADYWVANLRNPVRFSQAVAAAAENHATFIEISPHPLLTYAIGDALPATPSTNRFIVTSALKRAEDETLLFHTQLAALGVTALDADGGRLANIPTSPWLHSRHWVASRPHGQRLPDVHPLLGVHVEMPSGHDHVWQADVGTETMPWLADHMVHGQAVMTVAAYAEMALAAGREALGLPVEAVQVNGLEVEQTLALDRQTQVTTQLAQGDHGIRVEIHARSVGGNWSRYAVAGVDMAHGEGPAGCPEPRAEAGTWYSETEIALPDEAADHPAYCIHPVMLDAALQILAAAASAESLEGPVVTPYLPVSLATVRVFGRIGRWARCRAELVNPGQDGGGALGRIVLTDETGTPTAELTGVCLRRIDPGKVPLPLEQKIFDTQWVESSTSPEIGPGASTGSGGSWLLLADDDAETKALVAEFATRLSSPTRRVITEELSDESAVREAFAKATADSDLPPVGIIVFVGVRSFDAIDSDIALRRARELIWSIWVTARAAVDGWQPKPPRLWLVTRNGLAVRGNEPGDPAIGALKGVIRTWRFPGEAARVLAGEPDLGATLVDLDSADDVVAALMRELDSPAGEDVIAWRQERRYVERLTRATLDEGQREAVVRVDGSYIVTGGLGGLGMAVTRWLVQRGAGRLILNGRTEPSDGQQRDLADLASRAEIVFVRGDIASPGVAERLVAAAEETGRPLRGVVHAAGVSADGLVAALTREGLERVWAPKVAGALRLHAATLTRQLDWWVGFSSMASLLGLPGQTAYASANAWLDALTAWRRASGLPATAINWGQWSDVGMSSAVSFSVLDPITPAEGIEALESVVGGNLTRVGVARLRLDRAVAVTPEFRELGYFERVVPVVDVPNRDNRSTDRSVVVTERDWSQMSAEDRYAELQIGLRAILARELRMPASQLGVDRPFPELGLDSMMAMTVLRDTRRLIGVDLSANMLFNHPTISSLAAYLAEMLAPQQVPQDDRDANGVDVMFDSASGVLDELFASVESASAGSESGNYR
jgi:phthiocerol/phenolphthiocerol synthesis type-I polyketide synthase D